MSGSLSLNRHENVDLENLMRTYTPTDEWEFIAQLALKTTTWIPRPFSWRLLLNRNDRQQQQQQPGNNNNNNQATIVNHNNLHNHIIKT